MFSFLASCLSLGAVVVDHKPEIVRLSATASLSADEHWILASSNTGLTEAFGM